MTVIAHFSRELRVSPRPRNWQRSLYRKLRRQPWKLTRLINRLRALKTRAFAQAAPLATALFNLGGFGGGAGAVVVPSLAPPPLLPPGV